MPRSVEAMQSFHEAWGIIKDERRGIIADLVKAVIPRKQADAMPKRKVAEAAVAFYEEREQQFKDSEPFLTEHKDTFISLETILNYWPDIRQRSADDGIYIVWEPGKGVYGTTSKHQITKTFEAEQRQIKAYAERYNIRAERTNKRRKMQIQTVGVQLLLPPPVGETA